MVGLVLILLALISFVLALFDANVGLDLVVLGFVFLSAYFLVSSAPVARRIQ